MRNPLKQATNMYRISLLAALCIAVALGVMTPVGAAGARADAALLKKVGSTLDARTGSVAIEASAAVPYVASQPDPRTFVVELRDVVAAGFADDFKVDPRHPVGGVQVESAVADGVNVARVRITLRQPMRPRVRSARNMIYVEADRVDAIPDAPGTVSLAAASAVIRDIRVTQRGTATAVSLLGTSRLVATSIQEPKDGPRRVVIDFPNVTSAVASTTAIRQCPVDRERVGFSPTAPLVTQVTVDLARTAPYRVETSPDGNDLTLVFDEPVPDPIAALRNPAQNLEVITPRGIGPTQDSPAIPAVMAAAQAPAPAVPAQPQPQAPDALPVPPPQPPVGALGQTPPGRYIGFPVSLDFQDTDLRAVLRTFAEISGLNILIDPTIQGTVNVALRDIPWDQALETILRSHKLGYVAEGAIIRVAPLTVLAEEEAQRRKLTEEQALSGELGLLTRPLSYARAGELVALLTANVLSSRGNVQVDSRTNTIIITDLADRLQRAGELLDLLDRPEPQVEIEARIVQTNRDFSRSIGVQWGMNGAASTAL